MRRLHVEVRLQAGEELPFLDLDSHRVRIGSDPSSDVRLPLPQIAGAHAELSAQGDLLRVHAHAALDVDGAPVEPGHTVERALPFSLTLGGIAIQLSWTEEQPSSSLRTASLARELVRGMVRAHASPTLRVVTGGSAGEERSLPLAGRIVIGRGDEADWVLLDPDLSRVHLQVEASGDGMRVRDLDSKNGSLLDGKPIDGAGRLWPPGARLVLGGTVLELTDPNAAVLVEGPSSETGGNGQDGGRSSRVFGLTRLGYIALALAALSLAGMLWVIL